MRKLVWGTALAVGLGLAATPAAAIPFGFGCITNTAAANCTSGETQLAVDVTGGPGANQVSFTFTNTGPNASSIADVYFDDGTLLGIASIVNASGVSFSVGASPPNLPGRNNITPAFDVTAGFSADSDPPAQPNGVNPGETLTIIFNLQGGGVLQDVLDELASGELRIGLHVQGFSNGGSESFVNVPEPTLAFLLAAGALAGISRRKQRQPHRLGCRRRLWEGEDAAVR